MPFFTSPIGVIWYIIYVIQAIFSYGTAYRYTKNNGDNGVALFGWMLVFMLASIVPGLGIYFWYKSRKKFAPDSSEDNNPNG